MNTIINNQNRSVMEAKNSVQPVEVSKISKITAYRQQLKSITSKLAEMAKCSGREKVSCNQLLRECYQLTSTELHTFEEWKELGASIRKGQHAYLFWGKPVQADGYKFSPVAFLFAASQVAFAKKGGAQ